MERVGKTPYMACTATCLGSVVGGGGGRGEGGEIANVKQTSK